jgi:hypothetical protein
MAFEDVKKEFRKANETPVGGTIEGYVVGKYNGGLYPEIDSLEMVTEAGEKFTLSPNGSLKYFFKNGNEMGYLYRFTRLEDEPVKRNPKLKSAKWLIQVDRSKKIAVVAAAPVAVEAPVAAVKSTNEIPF